MVDQKQLLEEMQALELQRQQTAEQLHRIDGAIQLCRHLLAKGTQAQQAAAPETAAVEANGVAHA